MCITLGGLAGIAEVDFEELGTERPDLFFNNRAGVKGFNAGSETFCGRNRLKACDTNANDEYFSWGDGSCGSHHHRYDSRHAFSGKDDGHVAGEVGLGGDCIHFLRQSGSRHHFHGDRVDAFCGKKLQELGAVEGIEEADVERSGLQLFDHAGIGAEHPQDDVGLRKRIVAIGHSAGACLEIRLIAVGRICSGPRFDENLDPELNIAFDLFRGGTDAILRRDLPGDEEIHSFRLWPRKPLRKETLDHRGRVSEQRLVSTPQPGTFVWVQIFPCALDKFRSIVLCLLAVFPCAPLLMGQADPLEVPLGLSHDGMRGGQTARLEWRLSAADSALREGYAELARRFYAEVLAAEELSDGLRRDAGLGLASSLISLGEGELAYTVLEEMGAEGADVALRKALASYLRSNYAESAELLGGIALEELPSEERSWYLLGEGLLFFQRGETESGASRLAEARIFAASPSVIAQIDLLRLDGELKHRTASEEDVAQLRATVRTTEGQRLGYESRRMLAVVLFRLGRTDEAIEQLETLLRLPELIDSPRREELLLILGMMAGADGGRGRLALRQLLSMPADPELQRIALRLLANAPMRGELFAEFDRLLRDLIAQPVRHGLYPELLAMRAGLMLSAGRYDVAERVASRVLEELPGSVQVPPMLRLLATVNRQQSPPRYRTAASYLDRLRGLETDPSERARILGQMGDCFFLNGDFANAAEAYQSALQEGNRPTEAAERWLFQQVLAEIRLNQLNVAIATLDGTVIRSSARRWEAEYNLLDRLREAGETPKALQRIQKLVQEAAFSNLSPELQARLRWMQVRLTLDADRIAEVPDLCDQTSAWLEGLDTIDSAQRSAVASHIMLLKIEALLRLGMRTDGRELLDVLRANYPDSGPAMLSYLLESRLGSEGNSVLDTQKSLMSLVERFPESRYAGISLWEAALLAEQRGVDSAYREAMAILERLIRNYPGHSLVFYARLKQADLSRKLNDFSTALDLYDRLLADYPDHPERYRAEMSRGDCHLARGGGQEASLVAATVVYDRLFEDLQTPRDAAVEAGYKWATALRQRGLWEETLATLFLVKDRFFDRSDRPQLGPNGRYWLSRSLLELGGLQEEQGGIDGLARARDIYRLLIERDLPGKALAKARLALLSPNSAGAPPR